MRGFSWIIEPSRSLLSLDDPIPWLMTQKYLESMRRLQITADYIQLELALAGA